MSDRLQACWSSLRSSQRRALIPYVTPDFPVKGCTPDLVVALCEAGADIVEIGIPFSDPLADGPVIQRSSQIAIQNGATPSSVLNIVESIRRRTQTPIVLMGYVNSIMRRGADEYAHSAADAGVDGFIIADLSLEESPPIQRVIVERRLGMTHLMAPTSTDERIRVLDERSTYFSYCVSVTGVTGDATVGSNTDSVSRFLQRVRRIARKPFVVGFGITRREEVERLTEFADGAVVGSALLRSIADASTPRDVIRNATSFFSRLRT